MEPSVTSSFPFHLRQKMVRNDPEAQTADLHPWGTRDGRAELEREECQLSRGHRAAISIFIGKANLGQIITFSTDFSLNTTISLISRSNLEVWCLGVRRTSIYFSSSGRCGDGIRGWSVIAHACRMAVLFFL